MSHDCRDKGVQESKTRKRREERVKKPTAADDDEWETVTRTGKQLTIQVGGASEWAGLVIKWVWYVSALVCIEICKAWYVAIWYWSLRSSQFLAIT